MSTNKVSQIMKVLEEHDGHCLDNVEEREAVALALIEALWPELVPMLPSKPLKICEDGDEKD